MQYNEINYGRRTFIDDLPKVKTKEKKSEVSKKGSSEKNAINVRRKSKSFKKSRD